MDTTYKSIQVKSSEITSYSHYLSRRDFLKAAGILTGSSLLAACASGANGATPPVDKTDEFGDPVTSLEDVSHYNNYYEFSENKEAVVPLSKNFKTKPWTIEVSGLVN